MSSGTHLAPIEIPIVCLNTHPPKCTNMLSQKSLKIPKGYSEAADRRTANTMVKTINNDLQNTTQETKVDQHKSH